MTVRVYTNFNTFWNSSWKYQYTRLNLGRVISSWYLLIPFRSWIQHLNYRNKFSIQYCETMNSDMYSETMNSDVFIKKYIQIWSTSEPCTSILVLKIWCWDMRMNVKLNQHIQILRNQTEACISALFSTKVPTMLWKKS